MLTRLLWATGAVVLSFAALSSAAVAQTKVVHVLSPIPWHSLENTLQDFERTTDIEVDYVEVTWRDFLTQWVADAISGARAYDVAIGIDQEMLREIPTGEMSTIFKAIDDFSPPASQFSQLSKYWLPIGWMRILDWQTVNLTDPSGEIRVAFPLDTSDWPVDGVAIAQAGPNPENGKELVKWLLSSDGQEALSKLYLMVSDPSKGRSVKILPIVDRDAWSSLGPTERKAKKECPKPCGKEMSCIVPSAVWDYWDDAFDHPELVGLHQIPSALRQAPEFIEDASSSDKKECPKPKPCLEATLTSFDSNLLVFSCAQHMMQPN